jgi:hypothetical protein
VKYWYMERQSSAPGTSAICEGSGKPACSVIGSPWFLALFTSSYME